MADVIQFDRTMRNLDQIIRSLPLERRAKVNARARKLITEETALRGNGAREALIDIAVGLPNTSADDAARWTDWLLTELWMRGFVVEPIEC